MAGDRYIDASYYSQPYPPEDEYYADDYEEYDEYDEYADYDDYYDEDAPPPRRGPNLLLAAGVAFVLLLCTGVICLGAGAIYYFSSGESTSSSTSTTAPAFGVDDTRVGIPRSTPVPMAVAPSFAEIKAAVGSMSGLQLENYLSQLASASAQNWSGWVRQSVDHQDGQFEVRVDMQAAGDASGMPGVVFMVGPDVAAGLQSGQQITFSGTIRRVNVMLGAPVVELYNVSLGGGGAQPASTGEQNPAPESESMDISAPPNPEGEAAPAEQEPAPDPGQGPYSFRAVQMSDPIEANSGYVIPDANRMVGVEVVVGNVSGSTHRVDPYNALLIDDEGNSYEAEWGAIPNQIQEIDLEPGQETGGWIGFIVPNGKTPVKIRYTIATDPTSVLESILPGQ